MRDVTVLVVEADESRGRDLKGWLQDAGFNTLACAGPRGPSYLCNEEHAPWCLLPIAADLIVLDLHLESDTMMEGTAGWQLLAHYRDLGKPVVALTEPTDAVHSFIDYPYVFVLPREAGRAELIDAVGALFRIVLRPRSDEWLDSSTLVEAAARRVHARLD
ncbi:MAG: hypothetical protein ACXVQS_03775 [Actinomycetota bacterium]